MSATTRQISARELDGIEAVDRSVAEGVSEQTRSWRVPVCGALASTGALAALWMVTFVLSPGQRLDAQAYNGFWMLQRPTLGRLEHALVSAIDPRPVLGLGIGLILIGLWRRQPLRVGALAVMLAGANMSTELLKGLAPVHVDTVTASLAATASLGGAFPSGHATAAMSLALGLLLVLPRRMRPIVIPLGIIGAVAVAYALLVSSKHYPSDVIGGFLMAGAWAFLALGALRAVGERGSRRKEAPFRRRSANLLGPGAWAVSVCMFGIAAAIATGPRQIGAPVLAVSAGAIALSAAIVVLVVARLDA